MLEHTPQKSLRRLAHDTSIWKSSAAIGTKLLKFLPYEATAIHALQPRAPVNRSEGRSLQNEPQFLRRVKGKRMKTHL
jgi:hypothetical protein